MKTKLLTYSLIGLSALFIASQAYNTYTINRLKSKIGKVFDDQIDSLKKYNEVLKIEKDSLSNKIKVSEKIIDSLETYGKTLKIQRTKNTRYYNEKINNVNNSSTDSVKRFLSNYKYSSNTSQRNN